MTPDEPALEVEEEAVVDIEVEAGGVAALKWMNAVRLRHPRGAVHVEMDDAFRAAELGHEDAALDGGRVLLARDGRDVMRPDSQRVVAVGNAANAVARVPSHHVAEQYVVSPLGDWRRVHRRIGE